MLHPQRPTLGSITRVSKIHDVTVLFDSAVLKEQVDSAKLIIVDQTHLVLASGTLYWKKVTLVMGVLKSMMKSVLTGKKFNCAMNSHSNGQYFKVFKMFSFEINLFLAVAKPSICYFTILLIMRSAQQVDIISKLIVHFLS